MRLPALNQLALQRLVWVGVLLFAISLLVKRQAPALGIALDGLSAVLVFGAGIVLLIERSRS